MNSVIGREPVNVSKKLEDEFFARSTISQNGAREVFRFLSSPASITKMIIMAERELPSLTGIAEELEKKYGDLPGFPLKPISGNANSTNRQNVGRMIKFIMGEMGYIPVDGGLSERARLRDFAKSNYFSSGAIYGPKDEGGKYNVQVQLKEI